MIVCPACNQSNRDDAQHCTSCGAELADSLYRVCPSCGALNSAENIFCHRCLSELAPALGEPAAQDQADVATPASDEVKEPSREAQAPPLVLDAPIVPESSAQVELTGEADELPAEMTSAPGPEAQIMASAAHPEEEPEARLAEAEAREMGLAAGAGEDLAAFPEAEAAPLEPQAEQMRPAPSEPDAETAIPPNAHAEAAEPEEPARAHEETVTVPQPESAPSEAQAEGALGKEPAIAAEPMPEETPWEPADRTVLPATQPGLAAQDALAPLAGMDDAIPVETVVSLPHRSRPSFPVGASEAERQDAELFQHIVETPASLSPLGAEKPRWPDARTVRAQKQRVGSRVVRALLGLALVLAALTPTITGNLTTRWIQPREAVNAAADALASIPPNDTVLIAFDYSPAYAGELEPMALAVMNHLAARSVPMVAMSTQPGGIGSAERAFEALTRQIPEYVYGRDYAILGFLPGQEVGLRLLRISFGDAFRVDHVLGKPLGELAVTQNLTSLEDVDHIILLAEDGTMSRRWVEQVQQDGGVALYAFSSSRIEPLLEPYHQSGQIKTLVGAANGAAEYELASGAMPDAPQRTDGAALLFAIFVVIAIVTNVAYLSRGEPSGQE